MVNREFEPANHSKEVLLYAAENPGCLPMIALFRLLINRLEESAGDLEKEPLVVDCIIVHGAGLHESMAGKLGWLKKAKYKSVRLPKLSSDDRIRLAAVAELWQRHQKEGRELVIIPTGGPVYSSLAPSIACVSREYLTRRFKIPKNKIILADKGMNTVEDIKEAVVIMKKNQLQTAVCISSDYHEVARVLAGRSGLEFRPAEELLRERDGRYQQILDDINSSEAVRDMAERQKGGVALINIPLIGETIYSLWANYSHRRVEPTPFDPRGLEKMTGKDQVPMVK